MNIYEVKNKLNKIYNKIEAIAGYNYDTTYLKNELDKLNDKFDSMADINSPVQVESKTNPDLIALNALVNQLDSFTDTMYSQFKIFDDVDKINAELSNSMTKNKMNEIVELILNDALQYQNLYNYGFKNGKEERLFNKIYQIIKCEFRIKGSSTLLTGLIRLSVGNTELKQLIDQDIKNNLDKEDIVRRLNEVLSIDNIDLTMVYLLAINENGYKNEIIDRLKEERDNFDEKEKDYQRQLKIKKDKLMDPKDTYYHLAKGLGKSLKVLIPNLLSLTLLISANAKLHRVIENDKRYNTELTVYDSALGEYKTTKYTRMNMDDVLIEVIGEEKDNSRKYTDYVVENQGLTIEEYQNLFLMKEQIVSSGSTSTEQLNYDSETGEVKKICFPTNIDYSDDDSPIALQITVYTLINMFIAAIDFFIGGLYEKANAKTGNIAYSLVYPQKLKTELENIMSEFKMFVDNLKTKESGKYDKELYLSAKKEYEEVKKRYDQLLNEYNEHQTLLDYNGFTRKLK